MIIRKANINDLEDIMVVIKSAQELLKVEGIDQWQDGFPDRDTIIADISNWDSFVFLSESEVVGFVTIATGTDEGYKVVYDGKWLNEEEPYITIHRTAISESSRGLGLSKMMFDLALDLAKKYDVKSIRIDTHEDNNRMKHIIERNGYNSCGYILLARSNAKRVVYEKVLN